MPPRKQPPRLDQLCAATFARSLLERFVEIESLKKSNEFEEANRMLDEAKSLCENALPTPVLETYFAPIFQLVFLEGSKNGHSQARAVEMIFSCFCKPGMMIFDLSFRHPYHIPISSLLSDLMRPMSNLRVAILCGNATDEVLQLLPRNCKHLQVLDISDACRIDFETLKLFSPEAAKGFPDVHGCPKLVSFRLLRCQFLKSPYSHQFESLLKGLKHLKEFACEELSGAFHSLWIEKFRREQSDPVEMSDQGSSSLGSSEQVNDPVLEMMEAMDKLSRRLGMSKECVQPPTEDEKRPFRLKEISIFLPFGSRQEGLLLDFVIASCPELNSFKLTAQKEGLLGGISRIKHLTKLMLKVPTISPGGTHLSCFTSRLTSLELQVDDLRFGVLVAVGESCEDLVELKITLLGDSREVEVFPEFSKKAFRKLETLQYWCLHPSAVVDENEWLYLTSGATNLKEVRMRSNANFMTDEFWVNFLKNVNPLKFVRLVELVSKEIFPGFPMGRLSLVAFLKSCPELRSLGASFDLSSLPIQQIEEFEGKMKKLNFDFVLNRYAGF